MPRRQRPDMPKPSEALIQEARTLGFRVEPKQVHWAAMGGTPAAPIIIDVATLTAPIGWDEGKCLSWYRDQATRLFASYPVKTVAVRDAEAFRPRGGGQTQSLQTRCRIEGVIIEAANHSGLFVTSGRLDTISANLDTKKAKQYLTEEELRGADWSKYSALQREAILVAASVLEG